MFSKYFLARKAVTYVEVFSESVNSGGFFWGFFFNKY